MTAVKRESPNREQTTVAKVPTPAINPRAQKVPRDVPQVKPVEAPIRAVAENSPNVDRKTTATAQRANTDNAQATPSKAPATNPSPTVVAEAVSRQQRSENAPTENAATATPNRRATEVAATNPMAQPVADATPGQPNKPAQTLTASAVDTPRKQASPTRLSLIHI